MKSIKLLSLTILLLFQYWARVAVAGNVNTCSSILNTLTLYDYSPSLRPAQLADFHDDKFEIFLLNSAVTMSGNAFLVVPKDDSPTFVLKRYHGFGDEAKSSRLNDLNGLEYMQSFEATDLAFRVSKSVPVHDSIDTTMDYYPGLTLRELLYRRSPLSPDLKLALKSRYSILLSRIYDEAKELPEFTLDRYIEDERLKFSFLLNGLLIKIFIKSDNIIVSPFNLEMTLIDPY